MLVLPSSQSMFSLYFSYGLVASEVECKPFFFAVHVAFAHCGDPVVVRATGIETSVVVDDCSAVLVGEHFFAVDNESAFGFEKVFLAVQGTIFAKRDTCHAGFRKASECKIVLDCRLTAIFFDSFDNGFVFLRHGDKTFPLVIAAKLAFSVLEVVDVSDVRYGRLSFRDCAVDEVGGNDGVF